VNDFFIMGNLSCPATLSFWNPRAKANSFHSVLVRMLAIGSVLGACRFPQILKSIISSIPIYVVNLILRQTARHVKPCKPVSGVRLPINLYVDVTSVFFEVASLLPNLYFGTRKLPCENASFRAIMKDRGQVRMFHGYILPDFEMNCKD